MLLALVALAGLGVGALAAAGVFSHDSSPQPLTGERAAHGAALARSSSTHSTSTRTVAAQTQAHTTLTTSTVTVQAPAQTAARESSAVPFEDGFPGAQPIGRDARGFNVGPGCSDDPASSLPGCSDAPSVPNGDPAGTCPNGLTIDRLTTSCGLAESVYADYAGDGPVSAFSPERDRDYTFECRTSGAGTTGYRFCLGQAGEAILYVRWLP